MSKIITEQVEFTIKVDSKDFSFWEYRRKSYDAANTAFGYEYYNDNVGTSMSPLEMLIRKKVKRLNYKEALVFITDYSEKEGSFIVTFSFFIISTFMSYGSFRESLDYLRDDFNFFFRNTFPPQTNINVDYATHENRVASEIYRNLLTDTLSPIHRQLNIFKGLIGLIGLLSIGFALYSAYKVDNTNNTIPIETIQNSVRTEVDRLNVQRTNEELLKLLHELKKDTTKRPN